MPPALRSPALRRLLAAVLRPVARLLIRVAGPPADMWERLPNKVSVRRFGRGSVRTFRWYFEGKSAVEVRSVDDVCAWLLECEYCHDPDLFHEPDFWQHPRTFERLRKGDCEDHALWAWRKLVELGVEAELVSGVWSHPGGAPDGHVWIRFRQDGREYILETVARTREHMVRPFEEAKDEYVPHVGVDHQLRSYAYSGALQALEQRRTTGVTS
jgi:hypothetical protein